MLVPVTVIIVKVELRTSRLPLGSRLNRLFQGWDFISRACNDFTLASVFLFLRIQFPKLCTEPHGAQTDPLASAKPTLLRLA